MAIRSRASMRPGRFHPGNVSTNAPGSPNTKKASMRPGRFHPGNQARFLLIQKRQKGFNEAGAFPPRK